MTTLIITADDYGYGERYDEGILRAACAGAIDAVSAFSTRTALGAEPLLGSGIEIGLHLDLGGDAGASRATPGERERARVALWEQMQRFRELFGREPAYLDGHHHCHAREGLGALVCDFALARGLPVRSISPRHRRLLRCRGVATNDLLIGRLDEGDPPLPAALGDGGEEVGLPRPGVVEWMVHPGLPDPSSRSSYDAGRGADLELLLAWRPPAGVERRSHAAALLEGR